MNEEQAKESRYNAYINGDVKYIGCTCEKCQTNVYHTPSRSCVKCGQLKAGMTRRQKQEQNAIDIELAMQRYKSDIRHQPWV